MTSKRILNKLMWFFVTFSFVPVYATLNATYEVTELKRSAVVNFHNYGRLQIQYYPQPEYLEFNVISPIKINQVYSESLPSLLFTELQEIKPQSYIYKEGKRDKKLFTLAKQSAPILWVTPEEAALRDPSPPALLRSRELHKSLELQGPEILVEIPKDGGTYSTPMSIQIKFIAMDNSPIYLNSIKVLYLKWRFKKDITNKVKEYVSTKGISVPDAPLPKGKHTIQISLANTKKQTTTIQLSFMII